MQDNDLKHTSRRVQTLFDEEKSTGGVLPLKSPDLKPKETLWRELKFYLEWKVKPHDKQELVNCIKKFWERKVTPKKRAKYMDHVLQKVDQTVVEARETKYTNGSHRALLHLILCWHCLVGRSKWLFKEPPNQMKVSDQSDLCITKNFLQYWYS